MLHRGVEVCRRRSDKQRCLKIKSRVGRFPPLDGETQMWRRRGAKRDMTAGAAHLTNMSSLAVQHVKPQTQHASVFKERSVFLCWNRMWGSKDGVWKNSEVPACTKMWSTELGGPFFFFFFLSLGTVVRRRESNHRAPFIQFSSLSTPEPAPFA